MESQDGTQNTGKRVKLGKMNAERVKKSDNFERGDKRKSEEENTKSNVTGVEEEESDTESEPPICQISEAETVTRTPEVSKTARGVNSSTKPIMRR